MNLRAGPDENLGLSRLILASTSPYRHALLSRLQLPFTVAGPEVDETSLPGESATALAQRLAAAKATAIARRYADSWVIGSDQVAELAGEPLGKPGSRAAAVAQLRAMSGRAVVFHTALCLCHGDHRHFDALDATTVRFRALSSEEIERYLEREPALDCAGSFKSEGLGIALFEAIESRDPTALVGLPLIATAQLLREAGFVLP